MFHVAVAQTSSADNAIRYCASAYVDDVTFSHYENVIWRKIKFAEK